MADFEKPEILRCAQDDKASTQDDKASRKE